MRKFILKTILFLSPVLLYFSVPYVILRTTGENFNSVENILESNEKYLIGYAYNENNYKYVKWRKIEKDEKFDVLALGSSRALQFRRSMFDSSFYNAGYTINSLNDFEPFLKSVSKEKYPDYLIISLDQWMFNERWDNLKFETSQEMWSTSFTNTASFNTFYKVYQDLFKGKYSLGVMSDASEYTTVGLNARVNSKGFRNDGSMYYGSQIVKLINNDPTMRDYLFEGTLGRIKSGNRRFEYGEKINSNALNKLNNFLEYCKDNDIHVISFLPPFAPKVYEHMLSTEKYGYMSELPHKLEALFSSHNFEFYDYTYNQSISSDEEMIDGFHGGESTYLKMLIDMLNHESKLNKVANVQRLEKDLANPVNRFVVYDY